MTVVYIIPLIMTINPPYYDCCKSSIFLKTFKTTWEKNVRDITFTGVLQWWNYN